MKVLRRQVGESFRDCVIRYARDFLDETDVDEIVSEFDARIECGEAECDIAWEICDAYGLLDSIAFEPVGVVK